MGQVSFTDDELIACMGSVRNFAYSLTKCPAAGDDLVQEVMLRCVRKRHLFRGGNLEAWLFTMCRRLFYNSRRNASAKATHLDIADVVSNALAEPAMQEDHLEVKRLIDCFRSLGRRDQILIALVGIEGLPYAEVAQVLNLPIGTVRSGLSRARARLASALEAYDSARPIERASSYSRTAEACFQAAVNASVAR
ncbi:RNA polymerase sigma factor [Parvularcula dongshanensis]|uniref:RNA polymerase sigma-70 factor (ECF subfamily) n=1 Tax=Parvularcula dongshanensis TaxID=1173995 RepID=A0A840HZI2_9PROT|nr:sigma-70 family RNA polymerase sigma factor [Parvularcula dongshanensis]MBB4657515.1 RNA polymerase sigma-70 factor (ECF subfamily) [Parvularcula dongshanensis]